MQRICSDAQDHFIVVTEGLERVRIGRPCGRGQLHEARTDTQTTQSAPEWLAEQARFTRRRTTNEPWVGSAGEGEVKGARDMLVDK